MLLKIYCCTAGLVLVLLVKSYGVKWPALLIVAMQPLDYTTTDAVYLGMFYYIIIFTISVLHIHSCTNYRRGVPAEPIEGPSFCPEEYIPS